MAAQTMLSSETAFGRSPNFSMLGDYGDVVAQVAQGEILDIHPVNENLARVVMVEAGDEIGQC